MNITMQIYRESDLSSGSLIPPCHQDRLESIGFVEIEVKHPGDPGAAITMQHGDEMVELPFAVNELEALRDGIGLVIKAMKTGVA